MPAPIPAVTTPFGPFTHSVTMGPRQRPVAPGGCRELPGGGLVFHWDDPAAEVELLLTAFEADPGNLDYLLPVDVCRGAVWRVTARQPVDRLCLTSALAGLPEGAEADYEGTQSTAAIGVAAPGLAMTIAAPDEEWLCQRAEPPRQGVPVHFAKLLDGVYEHRHMGRWGVEYLWSSPGFAWVLPPLRPGDEVLLETNVCWRTTSPDEDPEDRSTWWAATTPSWDILAAAGGNPFGPGPATRP
ncbi:hypothetical protein ACIA8O_03510 [Kitasatospora sp. NPDC051853]|uniref:hypothetical protein n=1 Tax=Kitasatospora sp. NPDC051853 TaxID=3364058 RepID=UPI0037B5A6EC